MLLNEFRLKLLIIMSLGTLDLEPMVETLLGVASDPAL
jgi:hypothetical protein